MAFRHPRPGYALHFLIVPKKRISGVAGLDISDSLLLVEVIQSAKNIVDKLGLDDVGTQLIVNAGAYQEVSQLHFHLVAYDVTDDV